MKRLIVPTQVDVSLDQFGNAIIELDNIEVIFIDDVSELSTALGVVSYMKEEGLRRMMRGWWKQEDDKQCLR